MDSLLTLTTTNQKASAPIKSDNANSIQNDAGDDSGDFVSVLYAQIKNDTKESSKNSDSSSNNVANISTLDTKNSDKLKSSDEILLDEILAILNQMSSEDKATENFPQFSDNMNKILSNESVKNDFLNVKSLDDVINLSKKYNLGLENIKLSKSDIQDLKNEFKNLDFENFFNTKEEAKNTPVEKINTTLDKKSISTDKMMQNASATSTKNKSDENILGNFLKELDTKKDSSEKSPKETKSLKTEDLQVKSEDLKQNGKVDDTKELKDKKTAKPIIQTETKSTQTKTDINAKSSEAVEDLKQNIAKDSKNLNKELSDSKNLDTKEIKTTTTNEIKQQKADTKKGNVDRILHKIKSQKQTTTLDLNNNQNSSSDHESKDESAPKPQETKSDTINQKQEFKNTFQVQNTKTAKPVDTKSSLNQFSNDLKDKMEQFKSPIMKVQMTLSPKNLGEVDVTILNRGNNLHVNITSNSNTMSLFTQNQAEFKNSLVNMGFTNLEMNFSDQGKGSEQNQQNSKKNSDSFEEFSQQENSESTVELIVPRYI